MEQNSHSLVERGKHRTRQERSFRRGARTHFLQDLLAITGQRLGPFDDQSCPEAYRSQTMCVDQDSLSSQIASLE